MGLNDKWKVQGEMSKEQFELEMRRRLAALQELLRGDGWKFLMDSLAQREDELIQAAPASGDGALAALGELRALRYLASAPHMWATQLEGALKPEQ